MFDCHLHTAYSADSKMAIDEVVAQCQHLGIGCILTEHMDMDFPGDLVFECDVPAYFKAYAPLRSEKLLLGIEIGMQPSVVKENQELISTYPFDFVLVSTHVVDGVDLCNEAYYKGRTKEEAFGRYLDVMYENIQQLEDFDAMSHMDYISRYCPYEDAEITYEVFQGGIDQVLENLVAKGKVLEVNTKRFRLPGVKANYEKILRRYKELGGQAVTLGSDAHESMYIGSHFAEAKVLCDRLGLEVVYFKERRRRSL
ncbi:MAG: histidinol-phosphatase HisJ family protein [Cellulosilyticaceae bacterium]